MARPSAPQHPGTRPPGPESPQVQAASRTHRPPFKVCSATLMHMPNRQAMLTCRDINCAKRGRHRPGEKYLMRFGCALVASLVLLAAGAKAEPTDIVVRVVAKDAKFIGTETGGAQVTLRDADTGEVLAQGLTSGATGNTPKIMTNGHARREILSDDTAAKFATTLDIQRPRRITATATGPMMLKDAAMTVSSTQWILPGKPV